MNQEVKYGGDDSGRTWRAYPNPDNPALTVLEVMYESEKPRWEYWGIMTNSDMEGISFQKGIMWLEQVIEV